MGLLRYTAAVAYRFLFLSLLVVGVVGYLDHQARLLFWYWEYPWFDVLMHLMGGIAVTAFMMWAAERFLPTYAPYLVAIPALIAVGVSWEVFEWFAKAPSEVDYVLDTVTDLVMDGVGGALVISLYSIWKSK